jgi:hypothetical protein
MENSRSNDKPFPGYFVKVADGFFYVKVADGSFGARFIAPSGARNPSRRRSIGKAA